MPEELATPGAPPRLLIIAAALLALALVVAAAVAGLMADDDAADGEPGPLPLVDVEAPDAGSAECTDLLAALPDELPSAGERLPRRDLADPAPEGAAAWGDLDPVVLRCGVDRPAELTETSRLRDINGVSWLPVEGQASSTWYAVDRDVYVALTIPATAGTGPLQHIADTIDAVLDTVEDR